MYLRSQGSPCPLLEIVALFSDALALEIRPAQWPVGCEIPAIRNPPPFSSSPKQTARGTDAIATIDVRVSDKGQSHVLFLSW